MICRIQSLQYSHCNAVLTMQSLKCSPWNSVLVFSLAISPQFSTCNSDDPYHSVLAVCRGVGRKLKVGGEGGEGAK